MTTPYEMDGDQAKGESVTPKRHRKTTNEPDIDTPGAAWKEMEQWRRLPRQLRGGLESLQSLLVKLSDKEDDDSFRKRQELLDFVPWFWWACGHLGGLPFTKEPGISDDVPKKVREWMDDVDGQGTDLAMVLRSASIQAVGFGKVGLLLLPRPDDPKVPNLYLVDTQDDLDDQSDGPQPMRFRRWVSTFPDPARPWWKRAEEQIWTLYNGDPDAGEKDDARWVTWTVHEREKPGDLKSPWNKTPTEKKAGLIPGITRIPYTPWTAASLSEDEAPPWVVFPPLWWLARANYIWMNQMSDLAHNLRWSQVEQPYGFMPDRSEVDQTQMKGPGRLWAFTGGEGAMLGMLSPTGVGYANAADNLAKLEIRMDRLAHRTSASRFVGGSRQTATGVRVDLKEATSAPQSWTHGWSDSATMLLRDVGTWMGDQDPQYVYTLPDDFDAELAFADIRETVLKLLETGSLELEDALGWLAESGGLPASVDAEGVEEAVKRVREAAADRARKAAELPIPNVPSGRAEDEDDEDELPVAR